MSEPLYSSSSELRVMDDSPSSSELLDSLSSSSALRFVRSSSLRCCSWLTDLGVESVAGFGPVPVGVVRAPVLPLPSPVGSSFRPCSEPESVLAIGDPVW